MKLQKALITICTICVILLFNIRISEGANLLIHDLKFYGYFGGEDEAVLYMNGEEVRIKKGEMLRLEFNEYNYLDGVSPGIMDLEAVIDNIGAAAFNDIEIGLAIFSKVAPLIPHKEGPDFPDEEAMRKKAKWHNSIIRKTKKIGILNAKSFEKIVFEKINLKKLIDGYAAQKEWPMELKIKVSIKSQGKEKKVKQNSIQRLLKIPLPPY